MIVAFIGKVLTGKIGRENFGKSFAICQIRHHQSFALYSMQAAALSDSSDTIMHKLRTYVCTYIYITLLTCKYRNKGNSSITPSQSKGKCNMKVFNMEVPKAKRVKDEKVDKKRTNTVPKVTKDKKSHEEDYGKDEYPKRYIYVCTYL